jgi:nitroreductase
MYSLQTSPSGFNIQPTNVILIQNQTIKEKVANSAMLGPGNMFRTRDASAIAVFLADLEPHKRLDRIVELERKSGVRTKPYLASLPIVSTFLMGQGRVATLMKQVATDLMSPAQPMPTIDSIQAWSYKNTSLMAQTFVLSATSHGLSTCLMEGYDSRRMKEILSIPDRYDVPLVCVVGYEYEGKDKESPKSTPRLDADEVFFSDTFGQQLDISEEKC